MFSENKEKQTKKVICVLYVKFPHKLKIKRGPRQVAEEG